MPTKPLHPVGYRPPLNFGGHNFAPIDGDVPAPGQLLTERRIVGWRCRCGYTTPAIDVRGHWDPCHCAVLMLKAAS